MRRKSINLAAVVAVVFCGGSLSNAQMLIDNFEGDPPLGGWTLVDNTASTPWGSGAFDIVEDSGGNHVLRMHYTGTQPQPPGTPLTPLVALWNESFVNPIFSDGYLRAQVKVDEPNTVGSLARGDLANGNGYTLSMVALDEGIDHEKAGHQFHLDRFDNGVASLQWLSGRDDDIEFEFGEWWNMELGVVGTTISTRVWEVGTPEPPEPQFVWTDPSRVPEFQIGLYSLVQSELMPVPSRADASFDNVEFLDPETMTILVDIKPGSDPNSVNLKSKGVLPAAIVSTEVFDAQSVDVATLLFGDPSLKHLGGIPVSPLRTAIEDVSGDGLPDLTLKFSIPQMVDQGVLAASSVVGRLTGYTLDGTPFIGSDAIAIVPKGSSRGVPEPATLALILLGIVGGAVHRRR